MRSTVVLITTLMLSGTAYAIDPAGQRYIEQMTQGGMSSIKDAAQGMYNSGETNTQVLDVAAEVLLQNYEKGSDADTMAWVAKALGKSRNGRYFSVLREVSKSNADKKIRKYAESAMKEIGKESGEQYVKGKVNLSAVRNKKAPAAAAPGKPGPAAASPKAAGKSGLDVIRKGMSMQEAFDLVGPPTSSSAHPTGKAFIPFNFKGGDTVRSYARYKGQGRIIFSSSSHYDTTMRVIEVEIDPSEKGYP